jgi:hypothetical protein
MPPSISFSKVAGGCSAAPGRHSSLTRFQPPSGQQGAWYLLSISNRPSPGESDGD